MDQRVRHRGIVSQTLDQIFRITLVVAAAGTVRTLVFHDRWRHRRASSQACPRVQSQSRTRGRLARVVPLEGPRVGIELARTGGSIPSQKSALQTSHRSLGFFVLDKIFTAAAHGFDARTRPRSRECRQLESYLVEVLMVGLGKVKHHLGLVDLDVELDLGAVGIVFAPISVSVMEGEDEFVDIMLDTHDFPPEERRFDKMRFGQISGWLENKDSLNVDT